MTDLVAARRHACRSTLTAVLASAVALAGPATAHQKARPLVLAPSADDGESVNASTSLPPTGVVKVLPLADVLPQKARERRKPPTAPAQPSLSERNGQVTLTRYTTLTRNLKTGDIEAAGNVQLVYTEPGDARQTATLTADQVAYSDASGQIKASGNVRLERDEGTFVGTDLVYNFKSHAGAVSDAILEADYFRMRGKKITARGDGTYLVENGSFTTCIHTQPDYLIRARQLVVSLDPDKPYVSARGVTFYAGRTKLISLPFPIRRSLKAGATNAPVPLPGYDRTDGLFVRLRDAPILERHQTLDYDARINLLKVPTGAAAFETDIAPSALNAPPPRTILPVLSDPLSGILEQLTPPTYTEYADSQFADQYAPRSVATAVLENNEFVYNRRRNDLLVSRFPEIGIRLVNILGNRGLVGGTLANPNAPGQAARVVGSTEGVLQRVPNAPFLLNFYGGVGAVHEEPTGVTAGRIATRLSLASQPLIVGRRLSLRAGLTNWFNAYTTGTLYDLVSPELELDYVPTQTSRFGVAYRYLKDTGRTPFYFDRRDVRNELRLQYQVGGLWAFGIESKIDLDRSTAYDTELAIIRNFDCMQVGLAYRARSQSFNLIFNLLPPTSNRQNSRQQPLKLGGNPSTAARLGFPEDE